MTFDGTANVAVVTRSLYRCVSFASLIASYNILSETIFDMPPSKHELTEWVKNNQAKIGSVVPAGVGSDFETCTKGSEFLSSQWVDSAETRKNC